MSSCTYYNPSEGGGSNCGVSCQDSCQTGCQTTCQTSCQSTCEKSCQTAAQTNTAPTTPSTITVPTSVRAGTAANLSWTAASDPQGNLSGYILQRSIDNAAYTQIYKGANRNFSDNIVSGWQTVRYRVQSFDSFNAVSGWQVSSIVNVVNNVVPTISDMDRDLGIVKAPFQRVYQVNDGDASDTITITEKLNGTTIRTISNAARNTDYTVDITSGLFYATTLGEANTLEIEVADSFGNKAYRRYNFIRGNSNPIVTVQTADLGAQAQPFSFVFSATDPEGDGLTAKVLMGELQLYDLGVLTDGENKSVTMSKLDFARIPNGTHELRAVVTDANHAIGTGFIHFSKNLNYARYGFKKDVAARATEIVVAPMWEIASGATGTVRVCNNANDENPTWETVADLEAKHVFTNTTKTAGTWAVGVDVRGDRGTAIVDSYIYGFVGAYN